MILGLTGCPGSGKSLLAGVLGGLGWTVVDADLIGRGVVEDDPGIRADLAREFGDDILDGGGVLDRPLLAGRAFSSRERTDRLNRIVHPALLAALAERIAGLRKSGANAVVDCALVFEWGIEEFFDAVVCVTAGKETRLRRLMERDGRVREDVERLMSAQFPEAEKARRADIVLANKGSIERFRAFGFMIAALPECLEKGRA